MFRNALFWFFPHFILFHGTHIKIKERIKNEHCMNDSALRFDHVLKSTNHNIWIWPTNLDRINISWKVDHIDFIWILILHVCVLSPICDKFCDICYCVFYRKLQGGKLYLNNCSFRCICSIGLFLAILWYYDRGFISRLFRAISSCYAH